MSLTPTNPRVSKNCAEVGTEFNMIMGWISIGIIVFNIIGAIWLYPLDNTLDTFTTNIIIFFVLLGIGVILLIGSFQSFFGKFRTDQCNKQRMVSPPK